MRASRCTHTPTQPPPLLPGTVPIVNHTGGLADTVRDVADQGVAERDRNGFVFSGEGHEGEPWELPYGSMGSAGGHGLERLPVWA